MATFKIILSCLLLALGRAAASLPDYDAVIVADGGATASLTNAVTFTGTNFQAFNFGAVAGDATFECIVEGSPSGNNGFLAVGANSTSSLRFEQWFDTGQLGFTLNGVADYLFSPGVPTPATVQHLAWVWNGNGVLKLYVNGVLSGSSTGVSTAFGLPAGAGRLGQNATGGEGMTGTVYRVTCYDTMLPESTILRHADAFRGILRLPSITAFSATPSAVTAGAATTLSWTTTGAATLLLNGNDVTGQTQAEATLNATTNYTLTATNPHGMTSRSLAVAVIQPATHLVINEFVAENKASLADEDGEFSDWLELHNPTASAIQLGGYFLTDTLGSPQKWALPAVVLPAGGYRVVFLSSKNRAPLTAAWHTNFRLSKGGEYLALTTSSGVVHAYSPTFPPQEEDSAYGLTGGDATLAGYLATPTPGAANSLAPATPAQVTFSRPTGLLTAPFSLVLTSPSPNAEIYYQVNGSPTEERYTTPLSIAIGTKVTAWAERFGQRGRTTQAAYFQPAPAMAGYASPLPIMVIDNFSAGVIPQKGWNPTGAGITQQAQQSAYWAMWERTGATATLGGPPQLETLIGVRGRGAFSSTWRQKPYSLEAWQADGTENDVSPLGLPADADWILYYPDPDTNNDPTLLFNTFIYELSQRCGRYAPRFRWVDLFVNEDGGPLTLTDRRGVYLLIEKVSRGSSRLDFSKLSADGTTGGFLTSINRMDAIPVGGWPAENGATTPQFFRTAGPNRILQTTANVLAVVGDDLPQQYNAVLNFDNPSGYTMTMAQRAGVEGWFQSFEDALYNNATWRDPVNGYRKWLDERDFAEYFVFNDLSRNGDGMLISMFPWKGDDGRLRMGPTWDYNFGSYYIGSASPTVNLRWRSNQIWYNRLFSDPDFLQLYIDRWFAFRRGPMTNAGMDSIIDGQAAEITAPLAVQQGIPSAADYAARLTTMKNWLKNRANWLDGQYIRPPLFSLASGVVPSGQTVVLSAPAGVIYRTLDRTDPRLLGGGISSAASVGNTLAISNDIKITARVNGPTLWSAPTSALYVTDAQLATATNLVISEIHYHPAPPSLSEITAGFTNPDDFEFIELLNVSAMKVSLIGVHFRQGTNGSGIAFRCDDGDIWSLPPGGRAVLVKNRAAFALRYGAGLPVAGAYGGRLDNDGDALTLRDGSGAVLSTVAYQDACPWPAAADGAGYSLTYAAPGSPADPTDWRTSTATHGTPGTTDSVPYVGGDPIAYACGTAALTWTLAEEQITILQPRLPGTDAVRLSLEHSDDLATWTTLSADCRDEIRLPDDSTQLQWGVPVDARRFFRLRATLR